MCAAGASTAMPSSDAPEISDVYFFSHFAVRCDLPAAAALALGGCAVDPSAAPGVDSVAAHADAIQNGPLWNPVDQRHRHPEPQGRAGLAERRRHPPPPPVGAHRGPRHRLRARALERHRAPHAEKLLAPGDSGSSCALNGPIAGVSKAGNATGHKRLTSVAAFRDWVLGVVDPAEVDRSDRPALVGRTTGAAVTSAASGAIANPDAGEVTVMCPIARRRNAAGTSGNVVSAPRVFVDDRSAAGDLCCAMVATDATGVTAAGPARCSSGSAGNNR